MWKNSKKNLSQFDKDLENLTAQNDTQKENYSRLRKKKKRNIWKIWRYSYFERTEAEIHLLTFQNTFAAKLQNSTKIIYQLERQTYYTQKKLRKELSEIVNKTRSNLKSLQERLVWTKNMVEDKKTNS